MKFGAGGRFKEASDVCYCNHVDHEIVQSFIVHTVDVWSLKAYIKTL